jgi:hypothetical protein
MIIALVAIGVGNERWPRGEGGYLLVKDEWRKKREETLVVGGRGRKRGWKEDVPDI